LAASAAEVAAVSGLNRKIRRPIGVCHRNISSTRNPRCSAATSAASTVVIVDMNAPFLP